MPPDRAERRSTRQRVYQDIRQRIVSLELEPGASLSETELAGAMGVSRTPIREGLILLADEGLVQVFPKLGSFVSRIDAQKVADAQFIREALELTSIVGAVELATEEQLDGLRDQIARQREATDVAAFFELDELFHRSLLAVGGHESAWPTILGAKAHLDRARRLGLLGESSLNALIDEHEDVVERLAARDTEGTVAALRRHLRQVFDDIGRIREQFPQLFADDADARPTRRVVSVWQ